MHAFASYATDPLSALEVRLDCPRLRANFRCEGCCRPLYGVREHLSLFQGFPRRVVPTARKWMPGQTTYTAIAAARFLRPILACCAFML